MLAMSTTAQLDDSYWQHKRGYLEASLRSAEREMEEIEARETALYSMLVEATSRIELLEAQQMIRVQLRVQVHVQVQAQVQVQVQAHMQVLLLMLVV